VLAGTIYFPALMVTLLVALSVDMTGWALAMQYSFCY
jgi:hypothetical protein